MAPLHVLVAGASGALGRVLLPKLQAAGHRVRALSRRTGPLPGANEVHQGDALVPASLPKALEGIDVVFSAVGASVMPNWGDRRGFTTIDWRANLNLLTAAKATGVRRFVYVSVCHPDSMRKLPYIRAHEDVVTALKSSGLDYGVLRPTGFFAALVELVSMAKRGPLPVLGSGSTQSNPIHEADLADACIEVIEANQNIERTLGGPEVLTRRQMAEAAFAALGKPPRFRQAPIGVARTMGAVLRPFNPRLGQLIGFVAALSDTDVVAPPFGTHRLGDYFRERA